MDHNIHFFGFDQIQNPQYLDVNENPIMNDEFEAFMKANDDKMNDLEIKFDQFLKQCEQMQDDLLNQMRNFIQNFQSGPPGEDKEHEATTDTKLLRTEEIQPLPVQEPPQNSDMHQIIEECCVEAKSNAENLLPILSKCEVTLEDDMPAKDVCSLVFTTFSNPLFKDNDDLDSSNNESLPDKDVPAEDFKIYSNPLFDKDEINSDKFDPHCFNVESNFVESLLNRDTFIHFSSKFDFFGELAHIKLEIPKFVFDFEEEIRLIENLLYDNSSPRPPEELNAEIADTIIESIPSLPIPVWNGDSQREEIDIVIETNDVLPPSVENDDDYDPLFEEVDLFLSENSIPPGIENIADNLEGDIRFLEELLIDDSILSHESSDSNFEDNPKEIPVMMNDKDEDVDYSYSMFIIFDKMFSLLSAESEVTIFDPGLSHGD
nr:hypothetical protein [Tanacetum cinerariifolium]